MAPPPKTQSRPEPARQAALESERRRQLRGLLWLALAALLFLLWRARPLLLFHPGWWRL